MVGQVSVVETRRTGVSTQGRQLSIRVGQDCLAGEAWRATTCNTQGDSRGGEDGQVAGVGHAARGVSTQGATRVYHYLLDVLLG